MALSEEKRRIVINLYQQGRTKGEIAEAVEASSKTVQRIIGKFRRGEPIEIKKSPGRPPSLSPREERILVRMVLANPGRSSPSLAAELSKQLGEEITAAMVKGALKRNGFHGRRPARKPRLLLRHRKARLSFARKFVSKPLSFWKQVIFSDEAPFQIFPTFSGQWVWRRPHERLLPRNVHPTVKHGGGTVQVWGCMTVRGVGWMCRLPQGLDAETYITIIDGEFKQTVRHYYPKGSHVILQQDGASVHKARVVRDHLSKRKIPVLPWPAQSPDLNPVENLWADVKRRIAQRGEDITTKDELWRAIEEEWEATPRDTCRKLISSMRSRLKAVIKARGGPTKY